MQVSPTPSHSHSLKTKGMPEVGNKQWTEKGVPAIHCALQQSKLLCYLVYILKQCKPGVSSTNGCKLKTAYIIVWWARLAKNVKQELTIHNLGNRHKISNIHPIFKVHNNKKCYTTIIDHYLLVIHCTTSFKVQSVIEQHHTVLYSRSSETHKLQFCQFIFFFFFKLCSSQHSLNLTNLLPSHRF